MLVVKCTVTDKMVRVKTVRPDQFWTKNGLAGPFFGRPNLVRPDQIWQPKMVRPRKLIETSFNRLKWKEGPVYMPS